MPAWAVPSNACRERVDQPVVVGETDRRRLRMRRVGRLAGRVGVGVEGEPVHDREQPVARAVGGAHVLQERDRRVRVAARSGPVDAPGRERAAPDARCRVDRLERVVRAGEEREIRRRGRIGAVRVELRQPEAVDVRLVADDHVVHGRQLLLQHGEIGGELLARLGRQRRRRGSPAGRPRDRP